MKENKFEYPGKVGLQQRVLPSYRAHFFDHLSGMCSGGLSVIAGQPRKHEAIQTVDKLDKAVYVPAKNHHFLQDRYYLCYQQGLINWLEIFNPDVLILEANPRYLASRGARRWMHRRGRPVIGWGLGVARAQGFLSEFRHKSRIKFLASFDALIAYSSVGAEQYADLGIPPEQIHVAINSTTLPPSQPSPRAFGEDNGLQLLFVGRLQARKRVDLLIKACALMEPKPQCWIVGDGPERGALENLAREVYPATNFTGSKHGQELRRIFSEADLFVLPGTGGLAVQEAMAHGLPVVVAEGDGTQRDLVTHENGWLIKAGSLEDLTNALRQANSKGGQLSAMGQASYRIVLDRANIDAMAKVFVSVMNSVAVGSD